MDRQSPWAARGWAWVALLALAVSPGARAFELSGQTFPIVYPIRVAGSWTSEGNIAGGRFDTDARPDIALCNSTFSLKIFSQDPLGMQVLRREIPLWGYADLPLGEEYSSPVPVETPGAGYCQMHAVDVDGNGLDDLLVTHGLGLLVVKNQADGSLVRQQIEIGPFMERTFDNALSRSVLADFDGDADLDVIGLRGDLTLWLYANSGDGEFKLPMRVGRVDTGARERFAVRIAAGDLDTDGHADLAVAIVDPNPFLAGEVALLMNNRLGELRERRRVHHPEGYGFPIPAVGDVTGDGRDDLVLANYGIRQLSLFLIYRQTDDGELEEYLAYRALDSMDDARIKDLDGDGYNDLLFLHPSVSEVTAHLQVPGGMPFRTRTNGWVVNMSFNMHVRSQVAIHDFDGDGCSDLQVATSHYTLVRGLECLPASDADVAVSLSTDATGTTATVANLSSAEPAHAVTVGIRVEPLSGYMLATDTPPECTGSKARRVAAVYVCRIPRLEPGERKLIRLGHLDRPKYGQSQGHRVFAAVESHGYDRVRTNNAARGRHQDLVRRTQADVPRPTPISRPCVRGRCGVPARRISR